MMNLSASAILRVCSKCRRGYPPTTEYFHADKQKKDGLRPRCKNCRKEYSRRYHQLHREERSKYYKQWRNTIWGYLREVHRNIRKRCTDPKRHNFKNYGGRGIKLEFTHQQLYDWCITNSIDPTGLTIDRIDNDGNYALDNIEFITRSENSKKRWETAV